MCQKVRNNEQNYNSNQESPCKYQEKGVPLQSKRINMETRKHIAVEKKRCGTHNCAQAVACAYADLVNIPEQTMQEMTSAFGTGMGNMEGTCGAVVGAGIILGLKHKDRVLARRQMKQLMERFQAQNGATQCRKLKGVDTGIVLRQCNNCVGDAAEMLESLLD